MMQKVIWLSLPLLLYIGSPNSYQRFAPFTSSGTNSSGLCLNTYFSFNTVTTSYTIIRLLVASCSRATCDDAGGGELGRRASESMSMTWAAMAGGVEGPAEESRLLTTAKGFASLTSLPSRRWWPMVRKGVP
ncbi:hypothetical protein BC936DRAFT_148753, partial [Jimgerdemannia flammicorona]